MSGESDDVRALAEAVENLGGMFSDATGEITVLACAVAALVRSHPDPKRFASEFYRSWQLLGSPLGFLEDGAPGRDGIESMLGIVEEACPVPLNVRPGR